MKGLFFRLLFVFFCLTVSGTSGCSCGAGGETPPAEIPAPVSHLSISSPDSDGLVRVTGEAGFADGGSTVTVTNTSVTSFRFFHDLLIRSAWAQATVTVTVNADGSFEATLAASAGDEITVTHTRNGSATEVVDSVPEDRPPLPTQSGLAYEDVTYNPTTNEAIVVANDGTDGFLVFFNLSSKTSNTVTLEGLSGANRIDLDNNNQILVIADADDPDNVHHYHIPTGNSPADPTGENQVVDIAVSPGGNYAVIAFANVTPAFAFYDIVNDSVAVDGTAADGSGNNQRRAHWVALSNDGRSDLAALVSEADDGSLFLTTHLVETSLPSFTQQTTTALTGLGSPGGLVFFNQATECLVTDRSNDQVLSVVPATVAITSIDVEDEPRGIAVNSGNTEAYVVNGGERTLSVIDLTDFGVSRRAALGLSPTMVAVDPTGSINTVIILNSGDGTLTLFEP